MSRQTKTPRQRAEEALAAAERQAARLATKKSALLDELTTITREHDAAIARLDFFKHHPDLPQTDRHHPTHQHLDRSHRMTTTAKIAAKGTNTTGLTEEIAKRLHDNLGRTIVAVVEITSESRTEKRNGDEHVGLSIGMIEVAPDGDASEHIRELARLFHYERQIADGQPTLDGDDGPEPTVSDVLAQGAQFRPHPFLPVDAADDNGICDVCGQLQAVAVHDAHQGLPDPFAVPADEDDTDDDDEDDDEEPQDADEDWVASQHGDAPEPEDEHEDQPAMT